MSFVKDLGDLPPPSALSLQTIRAKVEKRTSIDTAPCAGSAVAAACKPAAKCCSSSSISPKSSPVGENRRDGRRDSRDSTVPNKCPVFSSVYKNVCVCSSYAAHFHHHFSAWRLEMSVILWMSTVAPSYPLVQSLANLHIHAKKPEKC